MKLKGGGRSGTCRIELIELGYKLATRVPGLKALLCESGSRLTSIAFSGNEFFMCNVMFGIVRFVFKEVFIDSAIMQLPMLEMLTQLFGMVGRFDAS